MDHFDSPELTHSLGEDESLDRLTGSWWIYQLKRGHRFSTDDIVTGWRAAVATEGRGPLRLLDIGCGIGTVGLVTLYLRGEGDDVLTGVEAQEISASLARKTMRFNGLVGRVSVVHSDLRSFESPTVDGYDLITGSPPYMPVGSGIISPHPQRAACRFELRGSVLDYCSAARRLLAPGGRFCFVMAAADGRVESAPVEAGLRVIERWDYVFRHGQAPLVCTMVCERDDEPETSARVEGSLAIRGEDGRWTRDYLALRELLGFSPLEPERNPPHRQGA